MPLVAGVDSSTGSTKVEVRDLDSGALVASGSAPHPPTTPPKSEQDPAAWWSAFESAWAQAASPQVAAISVGGQQHGMVAVDVANDVIRPAKLWNDTESAPDAGWLLKQLEGGAGAWAQACGSVPVAAFTITKLSWLHRSEPEAWARLARVMLPHDWLTFRLSGNHVTDRGDASGTGYWSAATGEYLWDLLAIIDSERDWSNAVPKVLGPLDHAGEWNGAMVGPGTGDNMAAALGLALRPGDVAISIGTSGTAYTVSETPTHDPSGSIAGFADATGRFLPLACTLNATKVTESVRRLLGVSYDELEQLALAAVPGADGLVLLPYLDGERTPNRPKATGVLAGIRSDVSREQLARAAYEGVVCSLLDAVDALGANCPVDGRVVLTGGGARSGAYRQMVADLLGRPVVIPDLDEAVATGACVQAAAVVEQTSPMDIAERWGLGAGTTIEPQLGADQAASVRAAYAKLRDATEAW
jgi:xylulokinase